jgi:nucleoside-diphosphate-sugar epimerase
MSLSGKYLVTGGAGFVGSHIVAARSLLGYEAAGRARDGLSHISNGVRQSSDMTINA